MSGVDDLLVRRAGYVPGFAPQPGGPGSALLGIAARQLDALAERLAQAPDKRGFALLDLVGVGLVAATAARAPVVFQPSPGLDHVTAPAGTRVGANVPGRSSPLVFETERPVAIAAARLVEVATIVPGRDAYTSHAADLGAGTDVRLFDAQTPFTHELYLAHPLLLALSGRSTVELVVALTTPSTAPLELEAAWWDGDAWRSFAPFARPGAAGDEDSADGTRGLTRGGTIRLFTPCGDGKPVAVHGAESSWIRLLVATPLPGPVAPGATLPRIERLRVRTLVERRRVAQRLRAAAASTVTLWSADGAPLAGQKVSIRDVTTGSISSLTTDASGSANLAAAAGTTSQLAVGGAPVDADWLSPFSAGATPTRVDLLLQRGLPPDKAMSDGRPLDVTKSFLPLGPNPDPGSALYLACSEPFTRPGAEVALELRRPKTAQEEADEQGAIYEVQINAALTLVHGIEAALTAIAGTLDALRVAKDANGLEVAAGAIGAPLPAFVASPSTVWYTQLKANVMALITIAGGVATTQLDAILGFLGDLLAGPFTAVFGDAKQKAAAETAARATLAIAEALNSLADPAQDPATTVLLRDLRTNITLVRDALDKPGGIDWNTLGTALPPLRGGIGVIAGNPAYFLRGTFPPFLTMRPEDFVALIEGRLAQATASILAAADGIRAIVAQLVGFDPTNLVVAAGGAPPALTPAVVAWEYWDGGRWAPLPGLGTPLPGPTAANLAASGVVRFTVPEGWEETEVAGDRQRWLRARLASGHYSRLRLVAWTDSKSNLVNFLPVIEPRPPVLDGVEITYRSASELVAPERATSFDDAEWRDHTPALAWPGPGFAPFRACRDGAPALYLGFEAPLPAETIGLFLDVAERPDARPLALRFEAWNGSGYQPVAVEDGTRGLTASGIVHLVWPGDAGAEPSLVVRGTGATVTLGDPGAGLRYPPGSPLWLADPRGGELVEVAARTDQELTLARPLSRPYAGALVRPAPPARLGRPLTWLRILLDADAEPPAVELRAIAPNAVWAANVETIAGEVPGGSDGTPGQVLFLRRSPVLVGEAVEVCELEGARAEVDASILGDELAAQGRPGDLRLERDATTGRITAAWVRWRVRDTLAFSDGQARDYAIDRTRGRLVFGDGVFGRIPPAGADNLLVTYRAGGDPAGNVPAGAISSVLSGVLARGVGNPLPAQGAAAGEDLGRLAGRGPAVLRHRHQALTTDDYEALAREASAAVARARALGAVDEAGRPTPGRVRLAIVPAGTEPAPVPTPELRRQVADLVRARAPLTATGAPAITVVGPRYATVGVELIVRPVDPARSAEVREAVRARALAFLHPLTGADGDGFPFGARLAASDLARAVAGVAGVDAIVGLAFVVDGLPQGEGVVLGPDRLPTAGEVRVSLTEVE